MLASIHPLGERARHNRWLITVAWYTAGSTAGGAVLGSLLGTLSMRRAPLVVALVCLLAAGVELSGTRPPGLRRQVNEDWLARYRGWVYGVGFGFQLGLGLATIVTTAAVYATFALAALSGSALHGLFIGAAFGAARAIPVLALRRVETPAALRHVHGRLVAAGPWPSRLTAAALVGAAIGGLR